MGLTKQYLRYDCIGSFGVIASRACNIKFINNQGVTGRFVAVGGADSLIIWDLRTGDKTAHIAGPKGTELRKIASSLDCTYVAAGFSNGIVILYDMKDNNHNLLFSLKLHQSAISCIRIDGRNLRIASGGLDSEIAVTDIVSQTEKVRLIGHKGPVTDVYFMENYDDILVSCSKDAQVSVSFKQIYNRTERG